MGTPVPNDWPEIRIGLWYQVTVNRHEASPFPNGCIAPLFDTRICCVSGTLLQEFIVNDWQCTRHALCVGAPLGNSQRITNIAGPYLTQLDCFHTL